MRGGWRSSRTRGGMRWTRAHQARIRDRRAGQKPVSDQTARGRMMWPSGRRSRVVLTPRRWRQGGGRHLLPNRALGGAYFRRRWWQTSPVTKESTKETVKTIACGNAGCPGVSAVTTRVLSTLAHGAAGAAGTRRSPRPVIFWARFVHNSGAERRGKADAYPELAV
jgi:hypothetical protein